MKKIIRLTEADLTHIVRKVIEEQMASNKNMGNNPVKLGVPPTLPKVIQPVKFANKTVNLYYDSNNSKMHYKVTIMSEPKIVKNGLIFIDIGNNQKILFDCTRPMELLIISQNGKKGSSNEIRFNNNLTTALRNKFCMSSQSGASVPKADFASVVQNSNDNFA
jgi:hypothetical protein